MSRPVFHVIAGPNGAGKSTLYKTELASRFPNAEFVNADLLAQAHYGKAATTREETETGQRLAEGRRRELMAEKRDLVTESTFSHPSKLDLVREAKELGYDVRLYHVNLRSADLAVKRVDRRVDQGGHPVPEEKTRERYERNQPIIREAAKLADRAYVFDNSEFGQPHRRVLELHKGQAIFVSGQMPAWARELYAAELQGYAPERLNRPAASFAVAASMVKSALGDDAKTYVARADSGRYSGRMIGETDLHVVQQLDGNKAAVAHFKSGLERVPAVGDHCTITYRAGGMATVATAGRPDARPEAGKAYVGSIREVSGGTVLQDVSSGLEPMTVAHDKFKLYKLGGGLNALLEPGKVVEIAYGQNGMGQVKDFQAERRQTMKR